MYTYGNLSSFRSRRPVRAALLAMALFGGLGCGSNSAPNNVQVAGIAFTDAGGTTQPSLKLLTIGESTNLSVNLTDDPQNLGANWSVYCGSAPPPGTPLPPGQTQDQSCGTFSPVHTMSGPIPSYSTSPAGYVTLFTAPPAIPKSGTVTLYASSTSNPSRSATVTLTIIGQYITIQFAPGPPETLPAAASTQVTAVVSNDVSNAGVKWTAICGSSDCGSFSPASTASGVPTTYTAPAAQPTGAAGVVQITATSVADPTRAVSSNVTIAAASGSAVSGVAPSGHTLWSPTLEDATAELIGGGARDLQRAAVSVMPAAVRLSFERRNGDGPTEAFPPLREQAR